MTPPTLAADVDTDTSSLCNKRNDQAGNYCVIAGTSITIASGMTLRAHGTKPLVLLATTMLDLEGIIDVSSKHGDPKFGAGAKPQGSCLGTTAAMGHSGGYGGSFGGGGGMGGTPVSTSGEAAGMPGPAIELPTALRGGCPGGDGAGNIGGNGAGGSGGGAIAIIASTIRLNGQINASGAGGLGGTGNGAGGGGGGGGSGGMIVLDALLIDAGAGSNVWLYANGGGGGQGGTGSGTGSGAGDDGMESPDPATQAPAGGNASRSGGRGGDGSAGTSSKDGDPAMAAVNSGDGGAGGGGAGFIRAPAIAGVMFAPTPTSP